MLISVVRHSIEYILFHRLKQLVPLSGFMNVAAYHTDPL